jgi:predicted DNA-binding protein
VVPGQGADIVKQMTAPLLVRLPADLHDRLRRWSTTNGFSMAAVARGLIERFLNDQERTRK